MDDLKDSSFRVRLLHGLAQNPTNFLVSAKNLLDRKLSDTEKKEIEKRISAIYYLLENLITESKDEIELIEKLASGNSDDQSKLNSLKIMLREDDELFYTLKTSVRDLAQELILSGVVISTIKKNVLEPINDADYAFINKLSRSSFTSNNDGFTQEEIKSSEFKSKILELFHEVPYYFEQAFSNTDIKVQEMLLENIKEKHSKNDKDQVKEFNNLNDLFMLSDIDNLLVKMKDIKSFHLAFQKLLTLLQENDKPTLINHLLWDNIIMKSFFQIDPKNPFYGLAKMFTNAKYPNNGLILKRYEILMGKDKAMSEIITVLKRDEAFKEAYSKYEKVKVTLDKKRQIENFFATLKGRETDEIKKDIIDIYDLMMSGNIDLDVLQFSDLLAYSNKLNQIIIKKNLHTDKDINHRVSEYFIYKTKVYLREENPSLDKTAVGNKSLGLSQLKMTSKSVVYGIDPVDVWYDTNRIFSDNDVTLYKKIYLKYAEKYAYEFAPKQELRVSNRELPLSEIRALPFDVDCVICAEDDEKRFNLFDLYINRLYQRIFKIAFKGKIIFNDKKNINKSKAFTISDENTFKKLVNDYAALVFIIEKDNIFFKNFYKSRGKELLKELISFDKSYTDICENVTLSTVYDYKELFNNRELLKRLYLEIEKKPDKIEENMREFIVLAPKNLNNLEKSEGFSK